MGRAIVMYRCQCGRQYLVVFGGGAVAADLTTWAETAAEVARSMGLDCVDGDEAVFKCSCDARLAAVAPQAPLRVSGTND